MASSKEFVQFVCDQIDMFGCARARHMFGEYLVYLEDRPIIMVCDDTVYIKMLPALAEYMDGAETGQPYPTAKPHYTLDIENRELLETVIPILLEYIPIPVKRKKRTVGAQTAPTEKGK